MEEEQHKRAWVQANVLTLINEWKGGKESDQDLVRTTQEYMATLNTDEITLTEDEIKLKEQVKSAMGGFISNRVLHKWDAENRESETQIIEMVLMCDESTLMTMFKRRKMEFSTKILEFANKIGGTAGQKIHDK